MKTLQNIIKSIQNFNQAQSEPAFILDKLLDLKKIKHTHQHIEKIAAIEPDADNMFGYVNLLKQYNIASSAGKVEADYYPNLQQQTPFITHLSYGSFAVVDKFDNQNVSYYLHNQPHNRVPLEEFEKTWDGVVLIPEFKADSTEKDYVKNLFGAYLPKISLILIFFFLIGSYFQNYSFDSNFFNHTYFLAKSIGFFISFLLIKMSYFSGSVLANSFCNISKKANCNSILQSPQATLFGGLISWTELGLFYFSATLLSLIFIPQNNAFLYVLSCSGFFFIFYSLYFQAFVLKTWCPLCLGILACIFIENIVAIQYIQKLDFLFINPQYLSILLLPIASWYLIKNTFIEHEQQKKNTLKLNKFKANQDIFYNLLDAQSRTVIPASIKHLHFGNPEAEIQLTIISNPTCPPCAKMHASVEKLLATNPEKIGLNLLWFASEEDDKINTQVANYFVEIYHQKGRNTCLKAIHDWFEKRDFKQLQAYVGEVSATSTNEVKQMYQFCKQDRISHTPYVLVNNCLLPDLYELDDLRSFL